MRRLKDIALLVLLAAVIGQYWYFSRAIAGAEQNQATRQKQNALLREKVQTTVERQRKSNPAATAAQASANESNFDSTDPMLARMAAILDRARRLKVWFEKHPEQRIGELTNAKDNDWFETAERFGQLETEQDFREAAAQMRERAESDFMLGPLNQALRAYFKTSNNTLPTDVSQLAAYLEPSIDSGLLQHYEMIAAGTSQQTKDMPVYALNPQMAVVDADYDRSMIGVGPGGTWSRSGPSLAFELDQMQARNGFVLANAGQAPPTQDLIAPYFKNPQFAAQFLDQLQKSHEAPVQQGP